MSDNVVKTEPEDDEENGRTTPMRQSTQEYESTVSPRKGLAVTKDLFANSTDNCAAAELQHENASTTTQRSEDNANDGELATPSVAGPIPEAPDKDELQDTDLLHLERTIARMDGESIASTDDIITPLSPRATSSMLPTAPSLSLPKVPAFSCDNSDGISTPFLPMATPKVPTFPHDNSDGISTPFLSMTANKVTSSQAGIVSTQLQSTVNADPTNTAGVAVKGELPATESTPQPTKSSEVEQNVSDAVAPPPPTISTVPVMRLRVKPEFATMPADDVNHDDSECPSLPNNFFDGILTESIANRPMIQPKDEPIPDNFFDDLLVDKLQERVEAAETQDLEVKFSDRLKQLEELDRKLRKERERKKQKKAKKKSRKRLRSSGSPSPLKQRRSLSRSPSPRRRRSHSRSPPTRRLKSHSRSPPTHRRRSRSPTPDHRKLMRWPEKSEFSDRIEMPSTSKKQRIDDRLLGSHVSEKLVPAKQGTQKSFLPEVEIHDHPIYEGLQPHLPEIREEFTAKQKRDRVIMRAKTLMDYLKTVEDEQDKPLSTFLYTSVVRKLPPSHSYRNQHIYENRSPLHNINNVRYKFNSHAKRFNLEEWGLASLPPVAASVAKLVGYDAQAIHNRLQVIKVPAKIRKPKRENGINDEEDDDEEMLEGQSSLFCSTATQTDEMVEVIKRRPQAYDIGVQAVPPAFEIACQTLETESPSIKLYDNCDDLPIMGIMREMNDNQLMALHDFAELLKEPASNAMDMYRLRQRMLDIYKCAQQPSTVGAAPQASVNNYSSNESSPSARVRNQDQSSGFRINSVEGGDGSYFSVNDPRVNFIGNRNRNTNEANHAIRHMHCNDPRNSSLRIESQRQFNTNRSNQQQMPQRSQPQTNAPKYYGRGGLRR
ncbi:uncharacterized protein LOC106082922 [Stomoxys calcitrans]|uniref:uncharacterized protein LOC106082922 n=1 Tax=Stomoxys calcitrans TaxID=35570 RepID=UPI0027E21B13|nr:uncharacterized protein LOC106082922 [Stomoxys calcitrans]